jgi:hypothetical protein
LAIACGHEDAIDFDRLGHDPADERRGRALSAERPFSSARMLSLHWRTEPCRVYEARRRKASRRIRTPRAAYTGPDGKFRKGNPGRRPGARHRVTVLAEKLMEKDVESITNVVIAKALEGNLDAAKIVLERIVPVRKGRVWREHSPR